jgi:hypothetical protein
LARPDREETAVRLFRGVFLALLLAEAAFAGSPGDGLTAEQRHAFEWMSGLGYPDVKTAAWGRVRVSGDGGQSQSGDGPEGFLIQQQGGRFKVLSCDLSQHEFSTEAGSEAPGVIRGRFESCNFQAEVSRTIETMRKLKKGRTFDEDDVDSFWSELEGESRVFLHGPGRKRGQVFVLAWACWRKGMMREARELLVRSREVAAQNEEDSAAAFTRLIAEDLAAWEAARFREDLSAGTPRKRLVDQLDRLARRFPDSESAAGAGELRDLLARMAREDDQRPPRRDKQPAAATAVTAERIDELIFELRDLRDFSGATFVFEKDPPRPLDAAEQLIKIGAPAVPRLIAVLDDPRPTRMHAASLKEIPRIGECAADIIGEIAGLSFESPKFAEPMFVGDEPVVDRKAEVRGWYAMFKRKGERQMLVEGTEAADEDSPRQAELLLNKFPDAAEAAITSGLSKLRTPEQVDLYHPLLAAVFDHRTESANRILLRGLDDAPLLGLRLMAAEQLFERGLREGVFRMIAEWDEWRPGDARHVEWEDVAIDESSWGAVAEFLARSDVIEALSALERTWKRRPIEMRLQMLAGLRRFDDEGSPSPDSKRKAGKETQELSLAAERMLVAMLDDTEQYLGGAPGSRAVECHAPRPCDIAAVVLSERWPDKYKFELEAPTIERDIARAAIKNRWRGDHGLSLSPTPQKSSKLQQVEARAAALLAELGTATDPTRRGRAVAELESLGVAALARIQRHLARAETSQGDRTALAPVVRQLSGTVADVRIDERSHPPEPPLRDALRDLRGKVLTGKGLTDVVRKFAANKAEAEEFRITLVGLPGEGLVAFVHLAGDKPNRGHESWRRHFHYRLDEGSGSAMSAGGDIVDGGEWLAECGKTIDRLREGSEPPSAQRPFIEIEIEPDD